MKHVWRVASFLALGWPLVAGAQQPAPVPPDYQQLLERALTREGSQGASCVQQREDLVKYFQAEIRKLIDERDGLRKQLGQAPAAANGK